MRTLYHATTYENMRMILGLVEADPEFDEANGFIGGKVFGFDGCVFLSEKPLDLQCVGGTYHVAVDIPDTIDLDQYRYLDDDDHYHCLNYAIPADIVNVWELRRYEI